MNAFQKYAAKRLLVVNLIEKLAAPPTQHFDFTKKKGEGSTITVAPPTQHFDFTKKKGDGSTITLDRKGNPIRSKHTKGMFGVIDKIIAGIGETSKAVFKPHPSLRGQVESTNPFGRRPLATATNPLAKATNPVKPVVAPIKPVATR